MLKLYREALRARPDGSGAHSSIEQAKDIPLTSVSIPAWRLYGQPLQSLLTASQLGDRVKIRTPWPVYLFNDPELAQHVLKQTDLSFNKDTLDYRLFNAFVAPGIITSSGEPWKRARNGAKQCLHHGQYALMQPVLDHALNDLMSRFKQAKHSGEALDIGACVNLLSYRVICYLIFGVEVNDEQLAFAQQLESMRFSVVEGLLLACPWLPVGRNSRMGAIHQQFDRLIQQLSALSDQHNRPCVYQALKQRIEPGQLYHELKNFIFSGSTVTNLMVWCFYALARGGQSSEKVYQESASIKGFSLDQKVLDSMKYSRCFVKEAMRLYPPVWQMSRRCTHTHTVCGHQFKKGDVVWVSPWTLHRNPRYWQDAEAFRPERFLNEENIPKNAYLPFSAGPRMCLGRHFGFNEALATVVTAASQFRFTISDQTAARPLKLETLISVKFGGRLLLQLH
ncbi:MAG: cytochrome P450 [Gammaproteobacteria bacterium]|nr:cytochrome P450 [Gammaproteobacteria bacterium]MDH5802263.1 cytochrome P450 [Gammaproteobacteria bacterium]